MKPPRWALPLLEKLRHVPPAAAAAAAGTVLSLLLAALGYSLWPRLSYWRAERAERKGRTEQAAAMFQAFAEKGSGRPRFADALFRSAELWKKAGDCGRAAPLYERLAREIREGPWLERAKHGLLSCPDYFPLTAGSLVYVDSQTGGQAMRLDLKTAASEDGRTGKIKGAYFAGKRRVQEFNRSYEKSDWSIWERQGKEKVRIIRYPYKPGVSWTDRRDGIPVEFTVVANDAKVKVKAGTFTNCLKIKERTANSPAWKFDYYAPGVGRVKTTIGGPGFESPNTELKSISLRAIPAG